MIPIELLQNNGFVGKYSYYFHPKHRIEIDNNEMKIDDLVKDWLELNNK